MPTNNNHEPPTGPSLSPEAQALLTALDANPGTRPIASARLAEQLAGAVLGGAVTLPAAVRAVAACALDFADAGLPPAELVKKVGRYVVQAGRFELAHPDAPDCPVCAARRAPRRNVDAEVIVLATILLDPEAIGRVHYLRPEHFYEPAHRHIFAACLALAAASKPVDATTVAAELRAAGKLEAIGGLECLARILDHHDAGPRVTFYAYEIELRWADREEARVKRQAEALAALPHPLDEAPPASPSP